MYENLAIGSQFGVFSTWMNGIYDVYNGNKLWIDDNGNVTTENTGVPYLTDVPLVV